MYMIFCLLILDRKRAQMENEDEEEIDPPGKSQPTPVELLFYICNQERIVRSVTAIRKSPWLIRLEGT